MIVHCTTRDQVLDVLSTYRIKFKDNIITMFKLCGGSNVCIDTYNYTFGRIETYGHGVILHSGWKIITELNDKKSIILNNIKVEFIKSRVLIRIKSNDYIIWNKLGVTDIELINKIKYYENV